MKVKYVGPYDEVTAPWDQSVILKRDVPVDAPEGAVLNPAVVPVADDKKIRGVDDPAPRK